jgi:hypothetical protein
MTGKDNLRCFLPDEQAWVYRWPVVVVFPQLLRSGLKQVHMTITDGNLGEIHQLTDTIKTIWQHKLHQRCMWHQRSKLSRIVVNYTEDQEGQDIRDEDAVCLSRDAIGGSTTGGPMPKASSNHPNARSIVKSSEICWHFQRGRVLPWRLHDYFRFALDSKKTSVWHAKVEFPPSGSTS